MSKFDYNLIAIGAGSGGLVSTFIASAVKAKVALIEKNKMGGDCLNTGCVPSKALISSAKAVQMLKKHTLYGLKNVSYEVDFALTMERVQEIITKLEPHGSVAVFLHLQKYAKGNWANSLNEDELEIEYHYDWRLNKSGP